MSLGKVSGAFCTCTSFRINQDFVISTFIFNVPYQSLFPVVDTKTGTLIACSTRDSGIRIWGKSSNICFYCQVVFPSFLSYSCYWFLSLLKVLVDMIRVPDWAFEAAGQEARGMGQEAAYQPGLYLTTAQVNPPYTIFSFESDDILLLFLSPKSIYYNIY